MLRPVSLEHTVSVKILDPQSLQNINYPLRSLTEYWKVLNIHCMVLIIKLTHPPMPTDDEGLSSPDFMIVHPIGFSRTTYSPLELHGFPPWHIRLTEI